MNESECIDKYSKMQQSYVKFWGTRGSTCVSGSDYNRFGGNTACLEIRDNNSVTIIDAGTGIRKLGTELVTQNIKDIHLIIGHFHWDHLLGFPFFLPIYNNQFNVHIYAPGQTPEFIKQQFEILLSREFFPIGLSQMQANITFHCIDCNTPIVNDTIKVHCCLANHPGTTYCFKIETPKHTIGYATDNEFLYGNHECPKEINENNPILEPYLKQIEFFKGCSLMIHEAQYLPATYKSKIGWGHSSTNNATVLIKIIEAKKWIVTHHDPEDTDDDLLKKQLRIQSTLQQCKGDCEVELAWDEMTILL